MLVCLSRPRFHWLMLRERCVCAMGSVLSEPSAAAGVSTSRCCQGLLLPADRRLGEGVAFSQLARIERKGCHCQKKRNWWVLTLCCHGDLFRTSICPAVTKHPRCELATSHCKHYVDTRPGLQMSRSIVHGRREPHSLLPLSSQPRNRPSRFKPKGCCFPQVPDNSRTNNTTVSKKNQSCHRS